MGAEADKVTESIMENDGDIMNMTNEDIVEKKYKKQT